VCANLPYVAAGSRLSAEVVAQPARALYADQDGSALVTRLLDEAPARLNPGGRVLAELDPSILSIVVDASRRRLSGHRVHRDLAGHERVIEAWS
jgi:release factor glutamine methyltransferase